MANYRWKDCRKCGSRFWAHRDRAFRQDECKAVYLRDRRRAIKPDLTPGQVDAMLSQAIRLESTPRYLKAPIPQTGVVYRKRP